MDEHLCIKCKERPVHIKKRGLCDRCYQRDRKEGLKEETAFVTPRIVQNHTHENELKFIRNYFNHSNWLYQPVCFKIDGIHYTPDFYDQETNTFIEVAGTRQAYSFNKDKYTLFRKFFPQIRFEVRTIDGNILDESKAIYPQIIAAKSAQAEAI